MGRRVWTWAVMSLYIHCCGFSFSPRPSFLVGNSTAGTSLGRESEHYQHETCTANCTDDKRPTANYTHESKRAERSIQQQQQQQQRTDGLNIHGIRTKNLVARNTCVCVVHAMQCNVGTIIFSYDMSFTFKFKPLYSASGACPMKPHSLARIVSTQ